MSQVIIVNGFSGCGKDTFINQVKEIVGSENVYHISIIDSVRNWAEEHLGYNGERDTQSRQMLFHCKKMLEAWSDFPYQYILDKVHERKEKYIFITARAMDDIDRLVAHFAATTLLIHKHYINWRIPDNSDDRDVLNREYDYTVYNDGSLAELKEAAKNFVEEIAAQTGR